MQNKNRLFSIISGALVIISMLFDIDTYSYYLRYGDLSFYDVLFIVSSLAKISLIVFLFMNNRKLAIISYALEVVISLIYVVSYASINNILYLLIEGSLLFILLSSTILSDKIDKKILKYIWFVPAALCFVNFIFKFAEVLTIRYYFPLSYFIQDLINVLPTLTIALWASDILVPKFSVNKIENANYTSPMPVSNIDGYFDLLTHILLLLFTFGIWQYIWIYKTTAYLNNTPNEERRDPTSKLLLCMFVPFYYIYWTYKSALRIDKLAISKGQQSDISTLCLILSIFVGIVPPIIMQDKINNIVKPKTIVNTATYTAATPTAQTTPVTKSNLPTIGVADEIMKYKELFDAGVITEDEFELKKKQLLGL